MGGGLVISKIGDVLLSSAAEAGLSMIGSEAVLINGVEEIKEELESIQSFLQDAERFRDPGNTTSNHVKKIQNLAVEIDNIIEDVKTRLSNVSERRTRSDSSGIAKEARTEAGSNMDSSVIAQDTGDNPSVPCGFVPYSTIVSTLRRLLHASHGDLSSRANELFQSLDRLYDPLPSDVDSRLPKQDLYVNIDSPPVDSAWGAIQRAITQVVVKKAEHHACDWYYDNVANAIKLFADNSCYLYTAMGESNMTSSSRENYITFTPPNWPNAASSAMTCGYNPPIAVSLVSSLGWVPYEKMMSTLRQLQNASTSDLSSRPNAFSETLRHLYGPLPLDENSRFPEKGCYVCVDRPPVALALMAIHRALMQVVVKQAEHHACDWFYDTLGHAIQLLSSNDDDCGDDEHVIIFNRETFESNFLLQWHCDGYNLPPSMQQDVQDTVTAPTTSVQDAVTAPTSMKPPSAHTS